MTKRISKYLLMLLLACSCGFTFSQTTIVSGKVTDKETGEILPFVNVTFNNSKIGTSTDTNGVYRIETYYPTDTLKAIFIGYEIGTHTVRKDQKQIIDFQLSSSSFSLKEVVVKYQGNPALKILKRVINNKAANNKEKYASYDYNVYNKVEFDFNNITKKFENRNIFKPIKFIFDYIDSTDGKRYLPILISESFSKYYYQQSPRNEKEYIKGTKVSGVENKSVTQFMGDMYQNINIYNNYIDVFGKQFVSPIANFGKGFYHYYLKDTAFIDGKWCYRIDFAPKRKQTPVFKGTMWINDTTYAVKKIDAEITASTNINYVKSYHIHQVFKNVDGKYWMLKKDQLFVDFGLTKKLLGLFGRKTTIYDSIRVNEPQPSDVYDPSKNVIVTENADTRTDDFWEEARLDSISKRESKIYQMVDSLKKVPLIKGTIDVVAMLLSGYLDWGNFQEVGS